MKIFCFGDSITFGESDYEFGGWANRLRTYLDNSEYNTDENMVQTFNLGVPGDRSDLLVKRMENEITARLSEGKNTIMIIAIGINDSYLLNGESRVSLGSYENNLNDIVKIGKKYSDNVILLEATSVDESKTDPCLWNSNQSWKNTEILKYNEVLKKLDRDNDLELIKVFDLMKENIKTTEDGLHPEESGHEIIFNEVKNKVEEILK